MRTPDQQRDAVSALITRQWSIQEWLASESAWDSLLTRSNADALFLSWQWLTHWWHYYGDTLGLVPDVMAFYRGDNLVGLAPLYRRLVVRAGIVRTRSVQVIGLSWRDPVPLISEYLDVIASPEDLDAVRNECMRVLLGRPAWTELVIGLTAAGGEWRDAFSRRVPPGSHYARELDRSVSYHADLAQGFAAYLKDLGQSTRRSVWNLRRRLAEEHGEVRFEFLAPEEIDSGFSDLNRLHQLRWNRPAFAGERLEFHKTLAARLAGISTGFLSDVENNKRSVSAETLLGIARVLSLSLDYLMKGDSTQVASAEVQFPARLAELAKNENISFVQALTLLDMKLQIVAHRSTSKSDHDDDFDWKKFE